MISLSELDTQRFGIQTARADDVTVENLEHIEGFCQTHSVQLLIARCSALHQQAVHAMQRVGFLLMDTLVYLSFDLTKSKAPSYLSDAFHIRTVQPSDEAQIKEIAAEAFADYKDGHYHNDEALDNAHCTQAYVDWAVRSCSEADEGSSVLVAECAGEVVGFLTMKDVGSEETELVLSGIKKIYQRQGVYRLLIAAGVDAAQQNNKTRVITSTQLSNVAVQKVWVRLGFEPMHSTYTFHKWYC